MASFGQSHPGLVQPRFRPLHVIPLHMAAAVARAYIVAVQLRSEPWDVTKMQV